VGEGVADEDGPSRGEECIEDGPRVGIKHGDGAVVIRNEEEVIVVQLFGGKSFDPADIEDDAGACEPTEKGSARESVIDEDGDLCDRGGGFVEVRMSPEAAVLSSDGGQRAKGLFLGEV